MIATRLTAGEFSQLPQTNSPTELIDGEIIMSPSAKIPHQEVVIKVIRLLIKLTSTGQIMTAPMDVHLDEYNVVQPDVFWVSGANSVCKKGEDGYWYGAPDFVVEVLSIGTAKRDRETKFDLYQQHGTREYWIIDPLAKTIAVYTHHDKRFHLVGNFEPSTSFQSPLFGQEIELYSIFPNDET